MAKRASACGIRRDVSGILRAPRRMDVADAVSAYMRVPMGAGNSVPWDPDLAPYVIEPMNCLASRQYDAVVFVGPARTGKTIALIDGWIVYNIVCDPADMLVIQVSEEKAREHSKKRLDRTFRSSSEVKTRLSPRRNDNNVHDRTFRAGNYLKLGWPSVNIMSSSDYKSVALTDYDRFPEDIDGEGDAFSLASKRTTTPREPQQPQPQAITTAVSDEATIRAQVLAEQKNRVNAINDLFAMFGGKHHELQNKCIADPECSVSQAKDELLAALGKNATPSNKTTDSHIYAGNGNFVGDGIRQALMARAGFESRENDNIYNGMTLREYARMALTERGIGVSSYNPMQMVGLALTHSTSDFGNILLDVANKSLLQGWDEAAETFEQWTKKGQLSDFKTAHRVGMGVFPSLRKVREGAEYKYVTTGDKGETIALATYGEIFSITRQAIINDDLNQLTDVPMKMGSAAKATIGDLVYAILTKNTKLSDGKPLFHADHKNLGSGAISVASIDDARKMMRLQKEGERSLNIRPAYMLVPVGLETLANQTIKSASVKGADINSGINNPIQNFAEVISDPRLDEADAKAWYLAAAKGTDTIEVAYLNGIDTPYIDQQEGFNTDGIATKVRIDAGVAPLDYRGLAKSSGQ
ncbi:phage terminase large subunit GpA [Yokenella regensburgei]|uniref:Phage terminase large subunit GpA n=1 Tax=Yokenella regensburgei TaxID=158877 RepID=A0ABX9S5R1_9ENTR|nr:ClpP-like prohead protease/major capsid protein fusion protein [Yokenella regensburgei]RKR64967.1 phage terminase large subunit GpA [Yokenella regensburgei]VFS14505.1 Bacteriophage tail assembly protein [Yokenella regensburgei]